MTGVDGLIALAGVAGLAAVLTYILLIRRDFSRIAYSTIDRRASRWSYTTLQGSAAVAFLVMMYHGASYLLSWMPAAWGSLDEDGEFWPLTASLATSFAVIGGGLLIERINQAVHERQALHVLTRERDELKLLVQALVPRDEGTILQNSRQVAQEVAAIRKRYEEEIESLRQRYRSRTPRKDAQPLEPRDDTIFRISPEGQLISVYSDLIRIIDHGAVWHAEQRRLRRFQESQS